MDNPFKQIIPDHEPAKAQIQQEVMSSIHIKSHMSDILEFFMAVFGIRREDVMPGQAGKSDALNDSQDPGHFF